MGGKDLAWDAEIAEQVPDQRVAWRSTTGKLAGTAEFQPIDGGRTRLRLTMEYDPEGAVENVGEALGVTSRRVTRDLKKFKSFIEKRGQATGAWRGEVHGGQKTARSRDNRP